MPSRIQRNTSSNRVHDIEFAAEISQSLLGQVRHLQTLLAERDETLKAVAFEKARLETEAEGFGQRLRTLDESEQRYKDENWTLETQTHDLIAAAKEAADREKKLASSLGLANSEKAAAQKELDDIKQAHGKLTEDHATFQKHHDAELSGVRRNMVMVESERGALQRKVDELNSQNTELARAFAQRGRQEDHRRSRDFESDDAEVAHENTTPEHSPPPSPTKGTPRHGHLESETLKSSLHHAHRMIQNLKGNIHREKTEKLELKRMLQEARDEIELRRSDPGLGGPGSTSKRRKANEKEVFKKPAKPSQLGGMRSPRSEVFIDEAGWEDGEPSPSRVQPARARAFGAGAGAGAVGASAIGLGMMSGTETSDSFETANEASESAFETAHEQDTTTEGRVRFPYRCGKYEWRQ